MNPISSRPVEVPKGRTKRAGVERVADDSPASPMERVDRLIGDLESGRIRYSPEIERKTRRAPDLGRFPCQKYVIGPTSEGFLSEAMPTEIVAHGQKPIYPNSVAVKSKLTAKEAEADLRERRQMIRESLDRLYAQRGESLMVLLEGDNAAGKDGMVKHVFHINPMTTGGQVVFKAATAEEREHAPNWRVMKSLAEPGQVVFHNRSHYGDVVFAATSSQAKEERLAEIKELEYGLTMGLPMTAEGKIALPDAQGRVEIGAVQRPPMRFLKILVGVSAAEQARRLADRLLNDDKLHKVTSADLESRPQHHQIQSDFANAMAAASTAWAPTYFLPNDNKSMGWRKMAEITDKILADMDPQPPGVSSAQLGLAERKKLASGLLVEAAGSKNGE